MAGFDENDPSLMTLTGEASVSLSTTETSMGRQLKGGYEDPATWRDVIVNFEDPWSHEQGGLWVENARHVRILQGQIDFNTLWANGGVLPRQDTIDLKASVFQRTGRIKNVLGTAFVEGLKETGEFKFQGWNVTSSGAAATFVQQACDTGIVHVYDMRTLLPGGQSHSGGDWLDLAISSPGGPPDVVLHRVRYRSEYQGVFAVARRGTTPMNVTIRDCLWQRVASGPWESGEDSYGNGLWVGQDPTATMALTLSGFYVDRSATNPDGVGTYPANTVVLNTVTPVGAVILGVRPGGDPCPNDVGINYSSAGYEA